jgi:hypothetical protein
MLLSNIFYLLQGRVAILRQLFELILLRNEKVLIAFFLRLPESIDAPEDNMGVANITPKISEG